MLLVLTATYFTDPQSSLSALGFQQPLMNDYESILFIIEQFISLKNWSRIMDSSNLQAYWSVIASIKFTAFLKYGRYIS